MDTDEHGWNEENFTEGNEGKEEDEQEKGQGERRKKSGKLKGEKPRKNLTVRDRKFLQIEISKR
jgi:hypothetical protein